MKVHPCGNNAVFLELANVADCAVVASELRSRRMPGIDSIQAHGNSVLVSFDMDADSAVMNDALRAEIVRIAPHLTPDDIGHPVTVDMVYDGEDLPSVAELFHTHPFDIIGWHADTAWELEPSLEYEGTWLASPKSDALVVPDKEGKGVVVPAGTVTVGRGMTAIHLTEFTTAWHVVGRIVVDGFKTPQEGLQHLHAGLILHFNDLRRSKGRPSLRSTVGTSNT